MLNDHRRNGLNGEADIPFGEHVPQHHPELIGDDITLSAIILGLCRDEADRRMSASICIREMSPKINDNTTSWQLLSRGVDHEVMNSTLGY